MQKENITDQALKQLKEALKKNRKIDFLQFSFTDPAAVASLKGLGKIPDEALQWLQAYQRVLKIAPSLQKSTVLNLLKEGIHSALVVAGIPQPQFLGQYEKLFKKEEVSAKQFHENAKAIKTRMLVEYMNRKQNQEVPF